MAEEGRSTSIIVLYPLLRKVKTGLGSDILPVERREFTPVEIPKEPQKEKQERCMGTYRLPEEETEEEETAGESLPGKPAPFRVW